MSWLALELYKHGMIKVGRFRLTSGLESPYYIDLRLLYSYPEIRERVVDEMIRRFSILKEADIIVGIATSGLALASFIACRLSKPLAYVRIEKKEHGTKSLVEGVVENRKAVIIDDVATTGGSIEHAINSLREAKAVPIAAITIVDREQGARERLNALGVKLYSLATATEIFDELYRAGLVSEDMYKEIIRYIANFKTGEAKQQPNK